MDGESSFMRLHIPKKGFACFVLAIAFVLVQLPLKATAAAVFVQTNNNVTNGGTSVSVSYTAATTANNLLVAICGSSTNGTITGPSGFSSAINQAGTPSQGIFYKIAAGTETSITCSVAASSRLGIHIYEYSGIDTTTPYHNSNFATGTSATASSGSVVTTNANTLLVAGLMADNGNGFTTWANTFSARNSFSNGGAASSRQSYGGADRMVTATGTYSTSATTSNSAWRGQIAAFNVASVVLSVDIVNASGTTVASPSVGLTSATISFSCNTSTGTLGVSAQRIRVNNTTTNPAWTIALAPTSGATSKWSTGTLDYDFNDASGAPAGCADGADADALAGQLSVSPAASTVTPQSGCTSTGVTRGSNTAYAEGTVNSITLLTGSASASINCYWDLTTVGLSQKIPAETRPGSYTLSLTLTITAN
jgi:hypothetical protein